MTKNRVTLRLNNNEVAIVGPRERWEHLITVYESFAADEYYGQDSAWKEAAHWIRDALQAAPQPKSFDDEWQ